MDYRFSLAGLLVGFLIGLTGMGGGSLLAPILILFFRIPPLWAVATDITYSTVTKGLGSIVHIRQKHTNFRVAFWLACGSVPSTLLSVFLLRFVQQRFGNLINSLILPAVGGTLLLVAVLLVLKPYLLRLLQQKNADQTPQHQGSVLGGFLHQPRTDRHKPLGASLPDVPNGEAVLASASASHLAIHRESMGVSPAFPNGEAEASAASPFGNAAPSVLGSTPYRPILTMLVGAVVGLLVGFTSVGSGTLIVVSLMFLYPKLTPQELVGTDIFQAFLLLLAGSVGYFNSGTIQWPIVGLLLLGSLPGVYLGSKLSKWIPSQYLRPVLAIVLGLSGLKLI